MGEDPVAELLELENLFVEADMIRLLAFDAVSREERVKVLPDGREPICMSFLLYDERIDWSAEEVPYLHIAALNDDQDNERLKKSGQILISYDYGRFGLEARRLTFLGEEMIKKRLAYRLSLPKIYQVSGRRKLVRHQLPADMRCVVRAKKKSRTGEVNVRGILFDVHAEGFCFAVPQESALYEKGDQIKVVLDVKLNMLKEIHCIARILSKVQYRKMEGNRREFVYFGCQVLNISDPHKLLLYIEDVRDKETEVRKASKASELTAIMLEKIQEKGKEKEAS